MQRKTGIFKQEIDIIGDISRSTGEKEKKEGKKRFLFFLVWSWPPTSRKFNFPLSLLKRSHSFLSLRETGSGPTFFLLRGAAHTHFWSKFKGIFKGRPLPFPNSIFSFFDRARFFWAGRQKGKVAMVASRLFPILFSPPLFSWSGDTHNGLPEKEKKKPPKKGTPLYWTGRQRGGKSDLQKHQGKKGDGRNICSPKKRVKKMASFLLFFQHRWRPSK